ncbi:MAG: hypothetical protein IJ587_04945 [Synergistaceae bacterium]|nr:hypothetical protein [Synergistaceae bacterium]
MGSSTETTTVPRKYPEPEELKNIRTELYGKIMPGLQNYSADNWNKARETADNAFTQQTKLLEQLPSALNQSSGIASEMAELARTGNIPSGLADRLNDSVNQELKSGMGNMLNSLANRGVVNSSIMSQGVNNLSQQAADAYNRNYLAAYQSALSGMGSALQGKQNNTSTLLSGINAIGNIPSTAYEGAAAELMPAFNLWKAMQSSYDNREDFDTIVTQESGSCVTGDTLVRLPDGKEIPVSQLKETDRIQAWDFENGCTVSVPLAAFFRRSDDDGFNVVRVEFEDGSSVSVIFEHLFFDMTLGKFVAVNSESKDFTGHEFAKVGHDGKIVPVKVIGISDGGFVTDSYAPQSEGHLNFLANGFISGNDGQLGLCNRYDFDTQTMRYDSEKKALDLERYGTLEYEKLNGIISEEFFDKNHCEEFSVSIGKGLITEEDLKEYLMKYSHCFLN